MMLFDVRKLVRWGSRCNASLITRQRWLWSQRSLTALPPFCRFPAPSSPGLLWGVLVETEAYCQSEPACHGHRRRSPSNETLFGEPGRFYVYVSYGIHHCVNVVTQKANWANGVLLRAVAMPGEPERVAAGPALLARRFAMDRGHDGQPVDPGRGLWLAGRPPLLDPLPPQSLLQTSRIGISQGQALPWRWYLRSSRSVSRRARGDRTPKPDQAFVVAAAAPGFYPASRTDRQP